MNIDIVSPEAVHEYEKQGTMLFNRSSHSFNKTSSISEGSARKTPKKISKQIESPSAVENSIRSKTNDLDYELPKIRNSEFEQADSIEDNKEPIRISEDVSETIPQEKYNLPESDNISQERQVKKEKKSKKHKKHKKDKKEKKEKKEKRAKAENEYEDDEFEQDD